MLTKNDIGTIYTDFSGLAEMKAEARQQTPESLRLAAKQFEAIFLQMTLKSMRESVAKSNLFGSKDQELFTGMYDQQLALQLSGVSGVGLADIIYQQLSQNLPQQIESNWKDPQQFIEQVSPGINNAATSLGISPKAILSVAALETGWGEHTIQTIKGENSYNLFGIKASSGWHGQKVLSMTNEFGQFGMQKRQEPFRVYGSAEESINDFVFFLKNNPRYNLALEAGHNSEKFFQELQTAGYATDPHYADKLSSVFNSKTMQLAFKKL